jgi:hypothetical protein
LPDKGNNNHKNYNNKGLSNRLKKEDSDKTKDKDKPIAKLLIVDDDPDISHVLKISLLKMDFRLTLLPVQKRHYKNFTLVQRIIL